MSINEILPLPQTNFDLIEKKIGGTDGNESNNASSNTIEIPRSIRGFDSYTTTFLDPFVAAATKLGGDAEKSGKLVKEAWIELRAFLLLASSCKEPAQTALTPLLSGIGSKIKEISGSVNRNEWEKHSKVVSEGVGALQW